MSREERTLRPLTVEIADVEYVEMSWRGLMHLLDTLYPADIFTAASGDLGPRLVALLREINEARSTPVEETP